MWVIYSNEVLVNNDKSINVWCNNGYGFWKLIPRNWLLCVNCKDWLFLLYLCFMFKSFVKLELDSVSYLALLYIYIYYPSVKITKYLSVLQLWIIKDFCKVWPSCIISTSSVRLNPSFFKQHVLYKETIYCVVMCT